MIINDYTPSEDIFRNMLIELINKRKITIEALETITSLSAQWFKKYINGQCSLDSLLESEKHFLTDLIILLTDGNTIDCDSRLKGIIDVLLQIYKFDLSTLGNCIGIDHKLITDFLNDESSISISDKYHLSVRIMFLYYMIKYPDYTKLP